MERPENRRGLEVLGWSVLRVKGGSPWSLVGSVL